MAAVTGKVSICIPVCLFLSDVLILTDAENAPRCVQPVPHRASFHPSFAVEERRGITDASNRTFHIVKCLSQQLIPGFPTSALFVNTCNSWYHANGKHNMDS